MRTNCVPLFADMFLYSYESERLDILVTSDYRRLARSINLYYKLKDDLITVKNKKFKDIYLPKLNVEKNNRLDDQANWLDLSFTMDDNYRLYTKLCDKCDDFKFHILAKQHMALHLVFTFRSF